MRGKPWFALTLNTPLGNIPAYAGKTRSLLASCHGCGEHPRVCGENSPPFSYIPYYYGTSPRMRGKRRLELHQSGRQRNIPAYAGKTPRSRHPRPPRAEHPRVCGENSSWMLVGWLGLGTSPRMRGKPNSPGYGVFDGRNIPAYAGKTIKTISATPLRPEHPRVCGENVPISSVWLTPMGTSPRMRGKQVSGRIRHGGIRNIPAYAGKTFAFDQQTFLDKEHPRVCGENVCPRISGALVKGTSPRMRGKLTSGTNLHNLARNIPAYAGKTEAETMPIRVRREHPRVCGENSSAIYRKVGW